MSTLSGWIPVEVRLPDRSNLYLVTFRYWNGHKGTGTCLWDNILKEWDADNQKHSPSFFGDEVIAWSPFPEPYTVGE
jgi:hypothetical protein